jgi:hypothetical protein
MKSNETKITESTSRAAANQGFSKNGVSLFAPDNRFSIQPKLTINQHNDIYEQEADSVADAVMRMTSLDIQTKPLSISGLQRKCAHCEEEERNMQRKGFSNEATEDNELENYVGNFSNGGQSLPEDVRSFYEPRFGYDFSNVRVHTDSVAAKSAQSINALAYTSGNDIVFNEGQYSPRTDGGKKLLAHELTHVVQQQSDLQSKKIQCRSAPYIKKITVHLNPPQTADMEWEGTPPGSATGADHFTVSTGKGYSNPEDPPGTCTRSCCSDPDTQCAPPWNQPGRVGACCTYYGNDFWTGTPLDEHNGWKWWTPIQPYYSSRGIALHQHDTVTGQPIGHGCVRMEEPNAKRIYDFSNGQRTNVTIDGRAAPVECTADRRCTSPGASQTTGSLETPAADSELAANNTELQQPGEGLEGLLT